MISYRTEKQISCFFFPAFCGGISYLFPRLYSRVGQLSVNHHVRRTPMWYLRSLTCSITPASSLGRILIKLVVTDLPFFDRYSGLFLFLFDFPHFLQQIRSSSIWTVVRRVCSFRLIWNFLNWIELKKKKP